VTKIYLDSCVIIFLIEGPEPLRTAIRDQVTQPLWVSDLGRLECQVLPLRESNQVLLQRYQAFFASDDVRSVSLTAEVFDLATELRARHRIQTPDALHLAAALSAGCDEFWTNDFRLSAAAKKHLEIKAFL
jgi:predicted nucleic acid-binding protein